MLSGSGKFDRHILHNGPFTRTPKKPHLWSVLQNGNAIMVDKPDKEIEISRTGDLIDFESFYIATKIKDIVAREIP